nr:MAG TPA: hypothetical protein [Caudoviricetes sp.]
MTLLYWLMTSNSPIPSILSISYDTDREISIYYSPSQIAHCYTAVIFFAH